VLRPLLSGLAVQPNLEQVIALMSQTLISRPNLEKVVKMAGLDESLKSDDDRTVLITRLQRTITIKGAGKENLYSISYVDEDRQVAERVVQSLVTLFMEGSVVDNRKDSESAREFIDEQLEVYRQKLEDAESSITEFKRRHVGMMPSEGPGYFARLDDAKAAVKRATLDLREAENSMESLRHRLSQVPEFPLQDSKAGGEPIAPESELDRRIAAHEKKLDDLRLTYTEQHPDIIGLVRIIEQLKQQRAAEASLASGRLQASDGQQAAPTTSQAKNPLYQQLAMSLATAEANVAVMRTRLAEYGQRYAELQSVAGAMPQVEAAYTQLTRDYELNKARYAELLKRRDSAQISTDMQSSEVALSFRVVDPPRVVPITPDPRLLITAVLGAALAGGLGVAFLVSQIKPTINDEHRLKLVTGLRVLGTVELARTELQEMRRKRGLAALFISFASLLSAYAAIMATFLMTAARI